MTEYHDRGLSPYYEDLGEALSKYARHGLCLLCLKGIAKEYQDKPMSRKRIGRPPCIELLLAKRLGVHKRTVQRWADLKQIQSNDRNATKLLKLAYEYDSERTEAILAGDAERYIELIDTWIGGARLNIGTSPYHDIPLQVTTRQGQEEDQ